MLLAYFELTPHILHLIIKFNNNKVIKGCNPINKESSEHSIKQISTQSLLFVNYKILDKNKSICLQMSKSR